MLRTAGRGEDGLAKAMKTDNEGALFTRNQRYEITNQLPSTNPITIAAGGEYVLPIIDWANEKSNSIFYSLSFTSVYPSADGFYRLEWQSSNINTDFDNSSYRTGRITSARMVGSDYPNPYTNLLYKMGKYSRLVIKNTGKTTINLRNAVKYSNVDEHFDFSLGHSEHLSISATASTTETEIDFKASKVVFLTNDGTGNITFNFNRGTTGKGAFVLKPGETISQLELSVDKLFCKASESQPFRIVGVL